MWEVEIFGCFIWSIKKHLCKETQMHKMHTQVRNDYHKWNDVLWNLSRRSKLYSNFDSWNMNIFVFFSWSLHQKLRLLINLPCSNVLMYQNKWTPHVLFRLFFHCFVSYFLEFCKTTSRTIFPTFSQHNYSFAIYIFRLTFPR